MTMDFRVARDFLLTHRDDYEIAYRDFRWPAMDSFNWALDWFDTIAVDNDRTGLWIVDDDDTETRVSFAEARGALRRTRRVAARPRRAARRSDPAHAR